MTKKLLILSLVIALAVIVFFIADPGGDGDDPARGGAFDSSSVEFFRLRMPPGQELSVVFGPIPVITDGPVRLVDVDAIDIVGSKDSVEVVKIEVAPLEKDGDYPSSGTYVLDPPAEDTDGSGCRVWPATEPHGVVFGGDIERSLRTIVRIRAMEPGTVTVVVGRVTYEIDGQRYVQDTPMELRVHVRDTFRASRPDRSERECAGAPKPAG